MDDPDGRRQRADDGPGRPLRLDDRALIEAALPAAPFAPAEWSFANLWLFRARHRYRLVDHPVRHVRGITYDGMVHALPLDPVDADVARMLARSGIDCLFPLGDAAADLAALLELPLGFADADCDYWYDASRMAALDGAPTRRGQARQFAARHAPRWEDWETGLAGDALAILDGWAADVGRPDHRTDIAECREAIATAGPLMLEGGVVRLADGTPAAFLLASRAGSVRIVHFAKGRRAHSHAYPWMFAHYAAASGADRLNFEQDLGNPGLAQSKRAYGPIRRQPKYRLALAQLR